MQKKRCLSNDFFEKKINKLKTHQKKNSDYTTTLSGLLQTTNFNSISLTERSNNTSSFEKKAYYYDTINNGFLKKRLKIPKKKKYYLPNNDYQFFKYFSFVPRGTHEAESKPSPVLLTEPNKRIKKLKIKSFDKTNKSVIRDTKPEKSLEDKNRIKNNDKKEKKKNTNTIPTIHNRLQTDTHTNISLKPLKNKLNSINARISFPYILSDISIMTDIYTNNLNYQKGLLREKYKMQ